MANSDGSVIIDTKIDTSNITKIGPEIQKQFKDLSARAKELSREINRSLDSVEADGVVDEINGAMDEVEAKLDGATDGLQEDIDNIDASGLEEGIAEPIEEGFREAEQASDTHATKIKDDIDGIGNEAQETGGILGNSLASGFMKVAKAIAGAAIVKELIDIGKQAIEIASDLQEVQNVVDVTFTTMSDQVDSFAKSAATSAGLSERMAKQYVGTFGAMATSFGFAEAEAYEMSTALTQLSGDLASFYNISQDEAMGKLKGIFTGETEALKELGVVMTQTALDAYALEKGFGKTTSAMTEQEKVTLRYQFVMDKLSAASGDFVRTQDSWANQTKMLSLQWEELMGKLGEALITVFLPLVQALNDHLMPALSALAEVFGVLMDLLSPLLMIVTDIALPALEFLAIGMRELFAPTSNTTGAIEENTEALEENADASRQASKETRNTTRATTQASAATGNLANNFYAANASISTATQTSSGYAAAMQDVEAVGYRVRYGLAETGESVLQIADAFGLATNAAIREAEKTAEYANVMRELDLETAAKLNEIVTAYETAHAAAVDSINSQIGLFDVLATKSEMTAGQIVENWGAQRDAFLNYADNIQKAIDLGIHEDLVAQLSDGTPEAIASLATIIGGIENLEISVEDVNAAYEGLSESKDVAADAMLLLNEEMADQMDELISIVTEKCGEIPDNFADAIAAAQGYIDSLTGKTVYVEIETIRHDHSGAGGTWGTPPIPELATGAVIPPNAPFMAILGDQKHGTNIEAPLDTMRKAFAEEASKIGGGSVDVVVTFDGDLAQLGRLLNPVIRVEEQRRGDNLAKVVVG